ncbi:hypothetical protein TUM20985_23070 [Mycobacterium antarcticum]|uniref:DUF732 domain-containing protein n=1 Tax=Mycolicibacterium sp. TUM20985 TaxID=3023370 RepID=UPI0025731296|nr:DUF732 domain-containing protein [Mycolicibacterium sp. TUM20985]BDX31760.1 hypothetical protein TUM20985_23070 [Mycolicibacterium sp. TUM20985]
MKKALLSLIAATFAVGLATAGSAHADEDGFFVDLTDYGYGDTSTDTALQLGYAICEDVQNGVPQQPPSTRSMRTPVTPSMSPTPSSSTRPRS